MALQENAERTADGVQKLGDMMRFMLQENMQEKIAVSREIDYLKNYIALQELRTQHSEDIQVTVIMPVDFCRHQIAPMLLIPLIENAFKHGISLDKKSWIKIELSCTTSGITLDIYNSLHKKSGTDPEKNNTGIGLENVRQRLQLLYPSNHSLITRESQSEYFVHLDINLN